MDCLCDNTTVLWYCCVWIAICVVRGKAWLYSVGIFVCECLWVHIHMYIPTGLLPVCAIPLLPNGPIPWLVQLYSYMCPTSLWGPNTTRGLILARFIRQCTNSWQTNPNRWCLLINEIFYFTDIYVHEWLEMDVVIYILYYTNLGLTKIFYMYSMLGQMMM